MTEPGGQVPAPKASSATVRRVMRSNRSRDTQPEMALRRALHSRGLRYRLHRRILPARTYADLAFPRQRIAVFVDGCFWHGCSKHFRPSRKNAEYWEAKIARNIARDRANDRLMEENGWAVLRIWEHEPVEEAAMRVAKIVQERERRDSNPRPPA